MRTRTRIVALFVAGCLFAASAVWAAEKTYQVTGPVLELTPSTIVVQKGKDRWEIARDSATNVPADLKVGDRVTIEYRMTAVTVKVKPTVAAGAKSSKGMKKAATK